MERIYTYEEVKKIHFESKVPPAYFDESIKDWLFHLVKVNMNEVQQISIWDFNTLSSMSNKGYRNEYEHIKILIEDLEKGVEFPPVILGWKQNGGYEVRDGKHRLSAMKHKFINEFKAFVRIPNYR